MFFASKIVLELNTNDTVLMFQYEIKINVGVKIINKVKQWQFDSIYIQFNRFNETIYSDNVDELQNVHGIVVASKSNA